MVFFLLDYHLRRLSQSAEYFDYELDPQQIESDLMQTMDGQNVATKVRLLVSRQGEVQLELVALNANQSTKTYRVKLAQQPIDSNDVFLFHKTTQRSVYQAFANLYPQFDDVLLVNEHGEITESCIANIAVKINGIYYTPPISSGLLGGTYRQYLLDNDQLVERIIDKDLLASADEVYLLNSVRKMWPVCVEF